MARIVRVHFGKNYQFACGRVRPSWAVSLLAADTTLGGTAPGRGSIGQHRIDVVQCWKSQIFYQSINASADLVQASKELYAIYERWCMEWLTS